MRIHQLITELSKFPPDLEVTIFIKGYNTSMKSVFKGIEKCTGNKHEFILITKEENEPSPSNS